jgi:CRISPR-associated protein Cas1
VIGRIVEIAEDRRHLSLWRGFLVVREAGAEGREIGRVPIDDVAAVITHAHGLSYTNNLLVALAERGTPFVLCGPDHDVRGMLWPVEGHHRQAARFDAQIGASRPMRKQLWAQVVRAKLQRQAATLERAGLPTAPLAALVRKVRSGDPDNIEAQGARRYWTLLLGPDFRRDRALPGPNALLNYGYTVLRSCVARAVTAAGLHPTLALHHANEGNAMRLVDDLMEPFRPSIDFTVWQLARDGASAVDADVKRALVQVLYEDLPTLEGRTPLMTCAGRLATSLAQVYLGERKLLDLPLPGQPLALPPEPRDA